MNNNYLIFVVEDDFGTNTIISNRLKEEGYRVTSVLHGSDLLEILEKNPPDQDATLFLIDYYLGDYNGDQLISIFKEKTITIPFIFFTSDNDISLAVNLMKKGARDFLIKTIEAIEVIPDKVTRIINEIEREKRLHQSEEKYKLLFENASDAIFLMKDRVFVDCNKRTLSMFHCSYKEIIGSTPLDFSPEHQISGEKSQKLIDTIINKAATGEPQYFEWQHKTKDNLLFPAIVSLNFINLPDANIMAVVRDISDLKKIEAELQYEKQFAETVIKTAQAIILVLDPEGNIVSFNPFMEELSGFLLKEVKGKEWFSTFLPACDHNKTRELFNDVKNDVDTKGTINPIITKDGRTRYIEWNNKRILDRNNESIFIVSVGQDITERIKSEEEAKRQEQQLIQSEKMAALGVLVSGIAHEINNPNNFILLSAEALLNSWQIIRNEYKEHFENEENSKNSHNDTLFKETSSFITNIIEGSNRIKKIINSLKEFSKKDNEDWNQPIQVNNIIKSAVLIVTNVIKKSTDHFSITYGKDIPVTAGNLQQLELVIINLIMNACQALPARDKKIEIITSYSKAKNSIEIKVNDEGVGIPKKILSRVVEPFFTTKMDTGGTGLGLSVSYSTIKKFNGNLEIESKYGTGTKITIVIPVLELKELPRVKEHFR